MNKRISFGMLASFLFLSSIAKSQFVDNYGIRLGVGLSNQVWGYHHISFNTSEVKNYKMGMTAFFYAEKELNSYITVRPEIGYAPKGFREKITFTDASGDIVEVVNGNISLQNLSLDVICEITPFSNDPKLYLIVGLRNDFLLSYKTIEYELEGKEYRLFHATLDEYEKFLFSGLAGVGYSFNRLVNVDLVYNHAFAKNYNKSGLFIEDRMFEASVAFNINRLIN